MWLAVLVLALAYTHGMGGENAAHHLSGASFSTMNPGHSPAESPPTPDAAPEAAAAAADAARPFSPSAPADLATALAAALQAPGAGHRHDGGSAHPSEQCMPGQPQLTATTQQLPSPEGTGQSASRGPSAQWAQTSEARAAGAAPGCPTATGVLRI